MTARPRVPKRLSTMLAEAPWGSVKSAAQLRAEAPSRYWSEHSFVEDRDYIDALNAKHRFFAADGRELRSHGDVNAAIARDGRCVSHE